VGFFRRRGEPENRDLTAESLPPSMLPDTTVGDAAVGQRSATSISAVYACVKILVDASLLCPLQVYRKLADGSRQEVTTGRLSDLLAHPGPSVTTPQLVAQLMSHLSLWGECLIGKIRNGDQIVGLEALQPDRVMIKVVKGEPVYTYYGMLGEVFDNLTTADVIHCRGWTQFDGIRGLSPIQACAEAFGLANTLTTAASATWANGAIPSGILTVTAGPGAQDQANSLKAQWQERQGGAAQRGKVAVITGDIGWQSVAMSLADAEFIAQQNLSLAEIARIFSIPPSRLNGPSHGSLTYSTTLAESTSFVQNALAPRLRLIEAGITADPDLSPASTYCEFAVDGLLRGDSLTRAQIYSLALNAATGWMTREEVRVLENLPREDNPPTPPAGQSTPLNLDQVLAIGTKATNANGGGQ
jgi:HK97 family phage portal protein